MQGLVDEPRPLNGQLSSPGEERGFFSGPVTLAYLGGLLDDPFIIPGLMRPSMVIKGWSPQPVIVVKVYSQPGYSQWNWEALPVGLVDGAAVSVDRPL